MPLFVPLEGAKGTIRSLNRGPGTNSGGSGMRSRDSGVRASDPSPPTQGRQAIKGLEEHDAEQASPAGRTDGGSAGSWRIGPGGHGALGDRGGASRGRKLTKAAGSQDGGAQLRILSEINDTLKRIEERFGRNE